jgi:hypothetical protein
VVLIFRSMQIEHTFSTFIFMKDKLHNRLGPNLDTNIRMFAHKFIHMKDSLIRMQSQHGRIEKCGLVLSFERFSFFLSMCLCFHDLHKFGEYTYTRRKIGIFYWSL